MAAASNERQALSGLVTPSRANPALASAPPRKLLAPTMAWSQSPCSSVVTAVCKAVTSEEHATEGPIKLKAWEIRFDSMSGLLPVMTNSSGPRT